MRLFSGIFLLTVFTLLVACSPRGNSGDSADPAGHQVKAGAGEPARGKINGKDWVFYSGRAQFKRYQANYLIVQLWNEDIADPCKEKKGSALQIRLMAPKELTTWNISQDDAFNSILSIFFSDLNFKPRPQDNMKADRGEITFTNINMQFVSGYIAASFQNPGVGGTHVGGDFVVPFCQ